MLIRPDWLEQCVTMEFPTWGSVTHPCVTCWSTQRSWTSIEGVGVDVLPWPDVTLDDYTVACNGCEHEITLPNRGVRDAISQRFFWDVKNKSGFNGKAMASNLVIHSGACTIRLLKGDRLEPDVLLQDICLFDEISVFPCKVIFLA